MKIKNTQISIDPAQAIKMAKITAHLIISCREALMVKHERRRKLWSENATSPFRTWNWRKFKFEPMSLEEIHEHQEKLNDDTWWLNETEGLKAEMSFFKDHYSDLETECLALIAMEKTDVKEIALSLGLFKTM